MAIKSCYFQLKMGVIFLLSERKKIGISFD